MRRRLLALLLVALVSAAVAGTVANAKGRLDVGARIPALPKLQEVANICPVPSQYRPAFARAAHDTSLPLAMLVAVGQVESNLQAGARSSADARGLLQVLPSTAAELRLNADRPASNVLAGARYLQAIAKTEGDICLVQHNQPDGLDLYYLGWCHGPAGTARLFYQLAQVTGDKTWMAWVQKSANALLTSGIPEQRTPGFWNNVSQCCGSAGVAQFMLDLYGVTHEPKYLAFAEKMTGDLLARATRDDKGTRWVQAEHRVRPELLVAQTGYMQGAAGIGAWLLRMDAQQRKRATFVHFPDSPW